MSEGLPRPVPPPAAGEGPPAGRGPAGRGRTTAWRVAQAVFIAAIVLFIARYLRHAWPAVDAYHWRLRPGLLVVSAVLVLVFYVLSALVWWLILRGSGLRPEPILTVATWGKSILARYLPGNVFMFVSRGWMSYRQGLDVDRVSAGMVYEQALNVAAALVVTAALFPFWRYERRVTAWALLAIPVIVIVLHPRVFAPLAALLLRLLHRPPLTRVLSLPVVLGLLAAFAGLWLVAGLALWTFAAAVTNVTAAAYPQITAGYAVAFVVGMVVFFVPSGIGVREGVLAAATASVFAGGGVALAWALLARLWQTALEIGFVAAATLAERLRRRAARPPETRIAGDERARRAAAPREGDDA
jgi:glycosyltransferase 2 family protein